MAPRDPIAHLPTHEVANQPPPFEGVNLYDIDLPLREALRREGGDMAEGKAQALGKIMGRAETYALADAANKEKPQLNAFDRYGRRIDEVAFHPAYHALMDIALSHEIPSIAWTASTGGQVAHIALEYLFGQVEGGVCCPITMTYAAIPALRHAPEIAREWTPKLLSTRYDPRFLPMEEKTGATMGMAMTEKQGGSDVRANTTRATPLEGGWYSLLGHKWFCSAPMSDAFLTLAQTERGLTCFFVPRWRPDGRRNPFFIQRLKDKLGNWSNASSEIEYNGTWGYLMGEEGRGISTILDMVHHTRLDTAMAPTAIMRQALVQAIHHARHRTVFQRRLADQPLMSKTLSDLALEVEGAVALLFRVARAYDEAPGNADAARFARFAVGLAKYHLNKLCPNFVYEALEVLGGTGYVEENIMPRLYREAPLNSIWEGSGNVICLDVLRTAAKEPEAVPSLLAEIEQARGMDRRLDRLVEELKGDWKNVGELERRARFLTERMATALQASLLLRHAPTAIADAFCATRLEGRRGRSYGAFDQSIDQSAVLERALPL